MGFVTMVVTTTLMACVVVGHRRRSILVLRDTPPALASRGCALALRCAAVVRLRCDGRRVSRVARVVLVRGRVDALHRAPSAAATAALVLVRAVIAFIGHGRGVAAAASVAGLARVAAETRCAIGGLSGRRAGGGRRLFQIGREAHVRGFRGDGLLHEARVLRVNHGFQ